MTQAALQPAEEFPMSLRQEIEVHHDYMVVVLRGQFSITKALALAKEMFEVGSQHKVTKVLVDIRQATGIPRIVERYQYARFLAEEAMALRNKDGTIMKLVYLGHSPELATDGFGEFVANNRGATVKATADEQEAWAWLGIDDKPGELQGP